MELLAKHQSPQFVDQYKSKILNSLEIPPYLFGAFWKALVVKQQHPVVSEREYLEILTGAGEMNPPPLDFDSEIKRDINRTFPNLKFYQELNSVGQVQLFNVLKAYCIYNPKVGYCQGMGFMVGVLLSHMDQVDAFNVLVTLMRPEGDYCMQGLYKPGLPLLNKYLSELDDMIGQELPRLANFFASLGIETSMFASHWILTLFVYILDWQEARLIFNLFLVFKMGIILKFALYILHRSEQELLTMGFEDVLGKINDMRSVRVADFVKWLKEREGDRSSEAQDTHSEATVFDD